LIGQSPLIFWGQRAEATITDILPCQTGVALSSKSGGFDFSIGESSAKSSTVRVRYDDAQGQEHIGQTIACTTLGTAVGVGDPLSVIFRPDATQDVMLEKDRGVYQTLSAATWGAALLLFALGILLVVTLRARLIQPRPAGGQDVALSGLSSTEQVAERFAKLAQQAIGPANYPTRQIRLKEALLLLHLRQASSPEDDSTFLKGYSGQLHDHFVLAAMLMELLRNGKIAVQRAGRFGMRARIEVLDPTPLGDPDTDAVLAALAENKRLSGRQSAHFYSAYASSHHLTARLIDQLRQGEYVRLHVPITGRFAEQRQNQPISLLGWMAERFLGPIGFNHGSVVATDDFTRALPWPYLYTTHTEAEERMFGRVQDAIAMRAVTDDFTRNLLILVAAHYLRVSRFSKRLTARYSLYRFYPPEEQRRIFAFLRQVADQAPEGERALYQLAHDLDDRIENPPTS
jgi:hypothetical protein